MPFSFVASALFGRLQRSCQPGCRPATAHDKQLHAGTGTLHVSTCFFPFSYALRYPAPPLSPGAVSASTAGSPRVFDPGFSHFVAAHPFILVQPRHCCLLSSHVSLLLCCRTPRILYPVDVSSALYRVSCPRSVRLSTRKALPLRPRKRAHGR